MPADQNKPIITSGVRFSSPGIPTPAPAANQPITKTEGSTGDPNSDKLRSVSGQIVGTSVSFRNPA